MRKEEKCNMKKSLNLRGSGNIVVFIGSTPNVGTTMTSFGSAYYLARFTRQKIGYLCLNLKSSKLHRYIGAEEARFSLDSLRAEMRAQTLQGDKLLESCNVIREQPNLYVLYGNMLREQADFFSDEDIEHLLITAASVFDVCIVEVNAYWDNAATICVMRQANHRIMVTTSELGHFQEDVNRWIHHGASQFGIQPTDFRLVVTQYNQRSKVEGFRLSDVRKETGMPLCGRLHWYSELSAYLNQGRLIDFLAEGPICQADFAPIVNEFVLAYGMERMPQEARRPWFHKWVGASASTL
jgi:hypothetical protein